MVMRFVGGPYDGREIDTLALHQFASILPVSGDLGRRTFVLMPPPESWDKMVGGQPADAAPKFPYEQQSSADGTLLVWLPDRSFDRALLEARLKVNGAARTSLATFPNELRQKVIAIVSELLQTSPDCWPSRTIRQLGDKPVYVVHLPSDLRGFVRYLDSGELELVDVVGVETLRYFQEASRGVGTGR